LSQFAIHLVERNGALDIASRVANANLLIFVSPGCAELGYDSAMKTQSLSTTYIHRSLGRSALLPILLLMVCSGVLPGVQAVNPPPDGGYPNQNTAEGDDALFSLTTGSNNTAMGLQALPFNTTGVGNIAIGAFALDVNTTG
jgi:hypothetical protein